MTIGTWRVLYLTEDEPNRQCMCQCVRCGVRKLIDAFKFRKGYALRCPECRIRQELAGECVELEYTGDDPRPRARAAGRAGHC